MLMPIWRCFCLLYTSTVIVSAMIEGKKAGIELYRDLLEAHYLAGGHVAQVVHALVSASKANIDPVSYTHLI